MICLDNSVLINRGKVRACYQHPKEPCLLIKVPVGEEKETKYANIKELKGYQALMREHVDLFCISHCYGFVSTNYGRGLVCDCIRDDDGAISKTIWDIIVFQDDCDVKYIQKVADEFCNFLMSRNIWLFDLNLKNIALRLRYDGTYQMFVIDLKGRYDDNELIPLSSYIKYFATKKLERRCQQLIERIPFYRSIRAELQYESL